MTTTAKQSAEESRVEDKKLKYMKGPWVRIEADALHSRNFTGKVDLGNYWDPVEVESGALARRIAGLNAEGYRNITTRRIVKEPE